MKFVPQFLPRVLAIAVTAFLSAVAAPAGHAASINYGDFNSNPPGVMFLDVTESSATDAVPLYGAPTFIGQELGFMPTPAFSANASGGSVDVTDGQLNYTIMSSGVTTVNASEEGTFSFLNVGTANTSVLAALSLRASVTQINGVDVAPIDLPQSNASVQFNMAANPAGGNWSLATSVDVATQLAALGFGSGQNATKVDVVIDNQLVAISEALSTATITKTRFGIPEPGSLALAALAMGGVGVASRKRRD